MLKKFILSLSVSAIAAFANPSVMIETTQGNIQLELFKDKAPIAVENFITHVGNGYYNGIIFHRIIKDFMIQGGDPTGTGRGGNSIWGKPFKDEVNNGLKFDSKGLLAMANSGPGTNGSQFFITTKPTPWLTGNHTIFGKVSSVEGFKTLEKLNVVKTNQTRPAPQQVIQKAYIVNQ